MPKLVRQLTAIVLIGLMSLGLTATALAQATPTDDIGSTAHPAHIHDGSCAQLGEVVAPLSDIGSMALNNGTPAAVESAPVGSTEAIAVLSSITTVPMALADIVAAPHAVNVHESAESIGNYIACGDIGGTMLGTTDLLIGIAELNDSGVSGVASLHDNGDGSTTVYVYLTAATADMGTPEATPVA